MIPDDRKDPKSFIQKTFIRSATADELVRDDNVRVIYYGSEGQDTGNPYVRCKYLIFDIYVKNQYLYGIDETDFMKRRDIAIFRR